MNRALPPGNRGNRKQAPGRASGRGGALPRSGGLVRRTPDDRDGHRNTALARRCLELIRDIADRGALAWDPEQIGFALQELSQVLFERSGSEDRVFEPLPPAQLSDLQRVYEELEFVDNASTAMQRVN